MDTFLGVIARSPNLKFRDVINFASLEDMMFYDFNTVYEKYDNITFGEWAKEKKLSQAFYDIFLQPALSVTLNERDIFSAAEMLTFMQIYFLTDSEADHREVAKINYYEAVLKPWVNRLRLFNTK